jgi:transposase
MDYLVSTSLRKLEAMYRKERDSSVKMRLLIVIHRKEGGDFRRIGKTLRISAAKACNWVNRFSEHGINGLRREPGSGGHNRYLTKEQESKLRESLKKQPMTSKEVRAYISENFGKNYHLNSMPRLLRRLGQSLITPRPRNYLANPRSGHAFRGHIKKVIFMEV